MSDHEPVIAYLTIEQAVALDDTLEWAVRFTWGRRRRRLVAVRRALTRAVIRSTSRPYLPESSPPRL